MTKRDTLKLPASAMRDMSGNPADMGRAELALLRKQRDQAQSDLRHAMEHIKWLEAELDQLRGRYGQF